MARLRSSRIRAYPPCLYHGKTCKVGFFDDGYGKIKGDETADSGVGNL